MENKQRYFLKKEDRLKSRKEIDTLFKKGKSLSVYPVKLVWMPAEDGIRAGFTVSSRFFKKATDRNRLKRLMRESWRLQKHQLNVEKNLQLQGISLFLVYIGKDVCEYSLISEKISELIKRLIKLTHEKA